MTVSKDMVDEFVAKIYCDLGKNVLTVGFASYFFEKLPLPIRIVFVIVGVGLLVYSVWFYKKGGK
ncbi:MAG: hypothetical protein Q7K71_04885 [Candidatus Omnitrophota bacterium]|nr:hypothetical protein [Candidatus Omnitrophota bacterium]